VRHVTCALEDVSAVTWTSLICSGSSGGGGVSA
jgi:hypothetical protein